MLGLGRSLRGSGGIAGSSVAAPGEVWLIRVDWTSLFVANGYGCCGGLALRELTRTCGQEGLFLLCRLCTVDKGNEVCRWALAIVSLELTRRFLALSDDYSSKEAAVRVVGRGRRAGAPGLPDCDDWTVWDAGQMRAVVENLEDDAVSTSGGSAARGR